MKVLVLRGGALGDFVVTLPALALLRQRWPEARIELAGNARAARLGLCRGYLDAVHPQNDARWSRLGADTPHALRHDEPLAMWLSSFDLVINFWPDPDGAIARDFAMLGFSHGSPQAFMPMESDAPIARRFWRDDLRVVRVLPGPHGGGPSNAPERGPQVFLSHPANPTIAPAATHFCEALRPLGLATKVAESKLFPTAADRAAAGARMPDISRECIALHPGSGSPRKNWPVERWVAVIRRLLDDNSSRRVIIILGEAEAHLFANESFTRNLPPETTVLIDDPPEVLAAILERCSLFLGHDTGPAHIAAAVGCPCVLVFGPTDPAMWAPPGPHVQALRRDERVDGILEAEVLSAARSALVMAGSSGRLSQWNRHGLAAHSGPA